ncbi:Hypothetical predicted protein [Pelobates cultripes]|uniref:Uncharacterized protein n=1 Tax=Pelobates cultripes TaxID=61616 RepID=A0AAD1QYW3_PELCU|nr:Hypothetical predicted protein [Pelobates cultripes]
MDQTLELVEAAGLATTQGTPPDTSNDTILQSIVEVKGFLVAEITRTAAEVKAAIGTRTTIVEQRMARMVKAHNSNTAFTNALQIRITDLELEIEDISNRARRNNLRIRELPETVSNEDLEMELVSCFRQGLPNIPEHMWCIDKAHRALRAKGPNNSPPRDVIIKWHYYKTKEAILKYCRLHPYTWEGTELQLYPDVAPATLQRRKLDCLGFCLDCDWLESGVLQCRL